MTGLAVTLLGLLVTFVPASRATPTSEQILAAVEFEQRIGAQIPASRFHGLSGDASSLAELSTDRPLLLVLSWFECPNLCPMVLDQVAAAARRLPFEPEAYRVAVLSIDPEEGADQALALKRRLQSKYGEVVADWRFLSGDHEAIATVTEAVGFRYAYDREGDRFAHPAGVVVIAPGGTVSHYLLQLQAEAPDLKLALMEAGKGTLGNPVQQVMLRCYRFNPDTGQYNLAVNRLLQAAGGVSLLGLGGLLVWLRRKEAP